MYVFDRNRQARRLGDLLGQGGEGVVHTLHERPDIAVKCFSAAHLAEHGDTLRAKIDAQIDMQSSVATLPIAWPKLHIFDDHGQWIGYAMRRAQGISLTRLAHIKLYEKYFPGLDRKTLVTCLDNLLATIQQLHRNNVYLGDINLNNFLCDPATGSVWLIDADSYQISHRGRTFPCLVGSPDMTAPEHHGRDFAAIQRTAASDTFSLAILLFKCLMLGRHPYDSIGGADPITNLRNGHFPYGIKGIRPGTQGGIPHGQWYTLWSHLIYDLKSRFIHTFEHSAIPPEQRAPLGAWRRDLQKYRYTLDMGYVENTLRPAVPKASVDTRKTVSK